MRVAIVRTSALVLMVGLVVAPPARAQGEDAVAFAKAIGITGNYEEALLATVVASPSAQLVLDRCGAAQGNAILADSVAAVVAAQGADWDRRVAALFSDRFSPEQMESIATLQRESPHFGTFTTVFKSEIQPAMIDLNRDIVSAAYVGILDPATTRAMAECPGG